MNAYVPAPIARHLDICITTEQPTQFIDLTDRLNRHVRDLGVQTGLLNVQSLHTTTAIVVNEHEPLLHGDVTRLLNRVAPCDQGYDHDDLAVRTVNLTADERANGHAHCRSMLLASSVCLNVIEGRLRLGRWQRVFLVELDGPRTRDVSVLVVDQDGGGRREDGGKDRGPRSWGPVDGRR